MIKNKIPNDEYKKILENIPICCVDLIIKGKKGVLLVLRADEPLKNFWWIPGGRIYKGEKIENAVIRKAYEETGLKVKIEKNMGTYETILGKDCFKNLKIGIHTINITFLVKPISEESEVKLDNTSLKFKWIDKIEENLHSYLKEILENSKIFEEIL